MKARNRIVIAFIVIVVMAIAIKVFEASMNYLPKELAELYSTYRSIFTALFIIIGGVITIQLFASAVHIVFKGSREAYFIRNIVLVLGYILLILALAITLGIGGEGVLAGATFSGLIIGLALQPVLSNFFSGLLILLSGYLKPGQPVRIAGNIPISLLAFPAYKFFSRDYMIPSLKGQVLEIGFIYTKILDADGQIVKISNTALLNSIVIEKSEESKTIQVRYEFPVLCNPDNVLYELHRRLQMIIKSYRLYIEEQIDKQYYIVLLIAEAPPNVKTREFRSTILKEFIKVHRDLMNSGLCASTAQVK
ncbi:MAG: mechanosensitive ion channel family protein [Ignisphaera sp.]